jgi:peptide/nickel transport system substrate-binding protein
MSSRLRGALVCASLAAAIATGCGDDDSLGGSATGSGAPLGTGNALSYALAQRPDELDPLFAATRSDQIVTRQVHEPLVESLKAPFGESNRQRGLAREWRASGDRQIWRIELRRRVRFQDGTPFNATAVLANVERWRTLREGRALLPELVAADAPRPDLVRLILSRSVSDFPGRLASPRLGIVSPAALRPRSGRAAELSRDERSGTGPFELRERDAERIVIARNVEWWGTRAELGPALDQVEFQVVPTAPERVALLRRGGAQVADSLPPAAAADVRGDPLLTLVTGSGRRVVGIERSVRGIQSASAIQSLSEVWLTTIEGE